MKLTLRDCSEPLHPEGKGGFLVEYLFLFCLSCPDFCLYNDIYIKLASVRNVLLVHALSRVSDMLYCGNIIPYIFHRGEYHKINILQNKSNKYINNSKPNN